MSSKFERLTPRETEVMRWILEGKTNSDISQILSISIRTVEKHCERIFQKLGVENRYAAIIFAMSSKETDENLMGEAAES